MYEEFKAELCLDKTFIKLYDDFENEELTLIFSSLHAELINLLEIMNEKLPTGNFYNYYPAKESRELIFIIEKIDELKNLGINFELEEYYSNTIESIRKILKPKAGSSIRPNTKKINIYYDRPIFIKNTKKM